MPLGSGVSGKEHKLILRSLYIWQHYIYITQHYNLKEESEIE